MSNEQRMTKAEAIRHLNVARTQRDDAWRERKVADEARDRLRNERDAAIRERDAAREDLKRAKEAIGHLSAAVADLVGAGPTDARRKLEGGGLSTLLPWVPGARG